MTREQQEHLEREVFQYKEQVSYLQDRLDSVTKVGDEELNNYKRLNSCLKRRPLISCFSSLSLFSPLGV